MDIVQYVCAKLGVTPQQAEAGLGILLRFAKEKLSSAEFAQVAAFIPNAASLAAAAPNASAGATPSVSGLLGYALSAFGGKAGSMGALATLANQFSTAGLDMSRLQGFAQTIGAFVQEKGAGEDLKKLLTKLLAA